MLVWQVLLTQPCKQNFQEIQEFANDPKQVNKIICLWIMISLKNLNALPLWDLLLFLTKQRCLKKTFDNEYFIITQIHNTDYNVKVRHFKI